MVDISMLPDVGDSDWGEPLRAVIQALNAGKADIDDLTDTGTPVGVALAAYFLLAAQRAAPDGVAPLDEDALLPLEHLPEHEHAVADVTGLMTLIEDRIAEVVGAAPAALDTLAELAAALGDDADFAATVTSALAGKADFGHGHALTDAGITGALPLTKGGTGATNAPTARSNLFVYSKTEVDALVDRPIVHLFTTPGPHTWTKPAGARRVRVTVVGGGGGGGGATSGSGQSEGSAGGGGGSVIKTYAAADLAATEAVTVGAGGSGSSGGNGTAGGNSTFKGLTAGGGGFGRVMTNTSTNGAAFGGSGGTASGGDVNIPGGDGCNGRVIGGQAVLTGKSGASLLATGVGQPTAQGPGNPGSGYGCGGGGAFAANAAQAGGDGAPGVVIVETW